MSQLKELKSAGSLTDVARLLGVKAGMLSYHLYIQPKPNLYTSFTIPKKHGGNREISAPNSELKLLQHRLSLILQKCSADIQAMHGHIESEHSQGISHGFKRYHTIMTNAREHVTRRYVFNVDLHDFFGTIHFGRVRGFFINDRNFQLQPSVATILAQIACHDNKLPQGSPCSPVISNLIGHSLDILLVRLAAACKCTYTRYADDLTFSSNRADFPNRIAVKTTAESEIWEPGQGLRRLVKKAGFSFNEAKTRMQYRDSRQEVTGLTVNRKANVPAPYRNTTRAMLNSLFTTGKFEYVQRHREGTDAGKTLRVPGKSTQLLGMLAYIDHVDLFNKRLCERNGREFIDAPGRRANFRRFLYFDTFYTPSMPVLVCEGKTDNIYIKHAIQQLGANYPSLINSSAPAKLQIRLLKYSERRTSEVMEITGGVGGLCKLIKNYHADVTDKFKAPPPAHPVIILIDNDSGANPIFGAISGITKKPRPTEIDEVIHVVSNLYVVLTPRRADGGPAAIENFFDTKILSEKLNGKSFEPGKDADNATHYGKAAFARDVISRNASSIDFGGFSAILDRILIAIDQYTSQRAKQT